MKRRSICPKNAQDFGQQLVLWEGCEPTPLPKSDTLRDELERKRKAQAKEEAMRRICLSLECIWNGWCRHEG